jgi:succinyl-CoA synthetase beta subunit
MDPTSGGSVIVACPLGGIDIEEIAKTKPEMIMKVTLAL